YLSVAALLLLCVAALALAQQKVEKSNMELVGYNDLQARSSYQPTIHKQGNRWIAYIGHHGGTSFNPLTGKEEDNGTSLVDVTDPKQPKYVAHIPGEPRAPGSTGESGGAQMVRVCDGSQLPRADKHKVYLLRSYGGSAHEVWDVIDPWVTVDRDWEGRTSAARDRDRLRPGTKDRRSATAAHQRRASCA